MTIKLTEWLICVGLVLAGCAAVPQGGGRGAEAGAWAPLPADEGAAVSALLAYHQRVATLPADDAKRELASANQAYQAARTEETRLRLGLVLLAPGTVVRDDARALSLLEAALAERPRNGMVRQFLLLLQGQAGERVRLLREEQRRSADLQQKLDALKAIDQSISDRERRRR